MAQFTLRLNGTEVEATLATFSLQRVVNGPDLLECEIQSEDASVRPDFDNVVTFERVDVSPVSTTFAGLVQTAEESAWTDHGVPIKTKITVFDYSVYAQWVSATVSSSAGSPADTLVGFLQYLVDTYLADYGVTLHPSQAAGVTLEHVAYDVVTVESILNELSQRTGWVWKIDSQKRLRMWDPLAESAPFNITGDNGTYVGDIVVQRTRQRYANRVIVLGGQGLLDFRDVIPGDGASRYFKLSGPLGYWGEQILVTISGITTAWTSGDPGSKYNLDQGPINGNTTLDYRITQDASEPILGTGDYLSLTYQASYPMQIIADGRGSPPAPARDLILRRPALFNRTAMELLAQAALDAHQVDMVQAVYETEEDISPGQTQTITLSERNLSAFSVTATEARLTPIPGGAPDQWRWRVTTLNSPMAKLKWLDTYAKWASGESTTGATYETTQTATGPSGGAATVTPGIAPGGSNKSVQYNDNGRFSGDSNFTWDKVKKLLSIISGGTWPGVNFVGSDGSMASLTQWDLDTFIWAIGAEYDDTSGDDIARGNDAVYLSRFGENLEITTHSGLTPGSAITQANYDTDLVVGKGLVNGASKPGVMTLNRRGITGVQSGAVLQINRNNAGGGAAGVVQLVNKSGTSYHLWVDASGKLRIGSSAPTEDGSVSDTSGTIVGTQT